MAYSCTPHQQVNWLNRRHGRLHLDPSTCGKFLHMSRSQRSEHRPPVLLGLGHTCSSSRLTKPHGIMQAVSVTSLPSAVGGLLDWNVVSAATQASFKLLFLCAVVAWLSERDMIPAEASRIMSKVAFSLTIPAMLLASTTKTLTNTQSSNLIALPIIAVVQIAIGAAFGRWAAAAVEGRLWLTRVLLGWGDLNPTPAAAAIAASTAAALRAPMAGPALLPKSKGYPDGLPQLTQLACSFGNTVTLPMMYLMTMLPAADASRAIGFMSLFHASWSPCLWLFGYRSITKASQGGPRRRRHGVISQLRFLWTRMTAILTGQRTSSSTTSQPSSSSSSTFSPPSSQPAVLITKQLPASAAGSSSGSGSRAVYAVTSESDNVTSSYEESPAEVLVKRAWRAVQAVLGSSVVQAVKEAINPPVAAVIAGVVLGLCPMGSILCNSTAAATFISDHTTTAFTAWEASLLLGVVRCCWETVELLASGTLALQAIVLAASLFGPKVGSSSSRRGSQASVQGYNSDLSDPDQGLGSDLSGASPGSSSTVEVESPGGDTMEFEGLATDAGAGFSSGSPDSSSSSSSGGGSSSSSLILPQQGIGITRLGASSFGPRVIPGINVTHRAASTADDASSSVISQLKPRAAWEWRTMLVVAAVRFVLLPCVTTALILAAMRLGLLPPEPVCAFMLLLQSCMPPAQNLVLMMQLQPGTAGLAPATARLLLQMYTLAVVPVTIWVSVFAKLVL